MSAKEIVRLFAVGMFALWIGLECGYKIAANKPKGRSHAYVTNN